MNILWADLSTKINHGGQISFSHYGMSLANMKMSGINQETEINQG